jgi:hypothetical protein
VKIEVFSPIFFLTFKKINIIREKILIKNIKSLAS